MHDIPYINRNVGPEIIAGMAAVCSAVKREVAKMPCGIQILAGCNEQAIAVAKACNLDFVRAEGFVFSHVADEGIMNSDAGQLLRYRKKINAENVLIFTDIKKKHRYFNNHSLKYLLHILYNTQLILYIAGIILFFLPLFPVTSLTWDLGLTSNTGSRIGQCITCQLFKRGD